MRGRTLALTTYAAAAVPARTGDAAAVVAAVLAGTAAAGPAAGGLLAAALTIPHLSGALAGRLLDRRRRPGPLLAAAFAWYALWLVVAALALGLSAAAAAVALALAGCAGPLVTGGLSSRLAPLLGGEGEAVRRAHGLDALTYGIAGAVGPALVAAAAVWLPPGATLAAVAVLPALAALPVLGLPEAGRPGVGAGSDAGPGSGAAAAGGLQARGGASPAGTPGTPASAPSRSALLTLLRIGPLRRTTIVTIGSAAALASIPLIAAQLGADRAAAALLVTAYGVGGLAGAALLVLRPLRGEPERLTRGWALATAAALALIAVAPEPVLAPAAFAVAGGCGSALLAATLAARTDFAPRGMEARVFATVAGVKVAGSSVGVAVAGLVAARGALPLALGAAMLCAACAAGAAWPAALRAGRSRRERRGRAEGEGAAE